MNGSAAVNRGRFESRKKAPATTGSLGRPPSYFDAAHKTIWCEISSSIPTGVAGKSDRQVVEMAVRLLYQFRTDLAMQASKLAILMNLLSRLGLDPQARTRLEIETEAPQEERDEWSGLKPATQNAQRLMPVK